MDVTYHEVVNTLLRSLDVSFETLVIIVQGLWNNMNFAPADVLERLNTHEFRLKKRERYMVQAL